MNQIRNKNQLKQSKIKKKQFFKIIKIELVNKINVNLLSQVFTFISIELNYENSKKFNN